MNKSYKDVLSPKYYVLGVLLLLFLILVIIGFMEGMPIQMFLLFLLIIVVCGFLFWLGYALKVRIVNGLVLIPGNRTRKSITQRMINAYDVSHSRGGGGTHGLGGGSTFYSYVFTIDNIKTVRVDAKNVIITLKQSLGYVSTAGNFIGQVAQSVNPTLQESFSEIVVQVANPQQLMDDLNKLITNPAN